MQTALAELADARDDLAAAQSARPKSVGREEPKDDSSAESGDADEKGGHVSRGSRVITARQQSKHEAETEAEKKRAEV